MGQFGSVGWDTTALNNKDSENAAVNPPPKPGPH